MELTIKEIIDEKCFGDAQIISGHKGLYNVATNITVLETPDGMEWLRGGEIILTAGYAFINNAVTKNNFIKSAHKNNAAAVCIKLDRFFGEIDKNLIEDSNSLGIPIFILKRNTMYTDLIKNFYKFLYNKRTSDLLKKNESFYKLLKLQEEDKSILEILDELSILIGEKVRFASEYEYEKADKNTYIPIEEKELGFLVFENKKDFTEFEKSSLKYTIALLKSKLKLEQKLNLSQSEISRMLTELILSNDDLDDRFFYNVNKFLDWNKKQFYSLYFKNREDKRKFNSLIRKCIENISNMKFLYVTDENGIAIFIAENKNKIKFICDYINNIFNKNKISLAIGISKETKDLKDIKIAYNQSKEILKLSDDKIVYFDDYPNFEILFSLVSNSQSKDTLMKLINTIKSYDRKNNQELLITLQEFVNCNFVRNKTASNLHIHTETLRYRLKKIEEITGLKISNSTDLIYIILIKQMEQIM